MHGRRPAILVLCTSVIMVATSIAQVPEPEALEFRDGVARIPDRATFKRLAHQGDAGRDAYLNGIEFVKFILTGAGGEKPRMYFMNTKTRQAHPMFMRDMGMGGRFGRRGRGRGRGREGPPPKPGAGVTMRGAISYRPLVKAPDGTAGTYVFDFQPRDSFALELLVTCRDIIVAKAPFLKGKLVYHPLRGGLDGYVGAKKEFAAAKLPVYLDDVFDKDIVFLPMNPGTACGRLRRMTLKELPGPRDVVLYTALPNELPRVAGMLTEVRQTPLSHVNLRAIQDGVPNAYVAGVTKRPDVERLVGKLVRYTVRKDGFTIRGATSEEVEAHFANLRPKSVQSPPLDLAVKEIRPLGEISYGQASTFGVKTTSVAALRGLGLENVEVPDGFGVPFSFYMAFMEHNGLTKRIAQMLTDEAFASDIKRREVKLKELRQLILAGKLPRWIDQALAKVQAIFKGTRIRCRSSTNNEDLPGFSGAGLYASCSHGPDEGPLTKSIKEVYASLWSDRAFEERRFYRVDHRKTAMGVLLHPSYSDEKANGVAVTLDILYQRDGYNYVNAQVGEDMVTNPAALSIPEELLIPWRRGQAKLMQASNRVDKGERVLASKHQETLKKALEKIHDGFARHYGKDASDARFAMEVEFKITAADKLAIKQARPWIFATEPPPADTKKK